MPIPAPQPMPPPIPGPTVVVLMLSICVRRNLVTGNSDFPVLTSGLRLQSLLVDPIGFVIGQMTITEL